MGLTAQEARELVRGSMKHKGLFFRIKLIFLCGLIDRKIENASEEGNFEIELIPNSSDYKKYMPLIWQCYENLGYKLYRTYESAERVYISWDPDLDLYECRYYSLTERYTK